MSYYREQIVYSVRDKQPCKAYTSDGKETHFIALIGEGDSQRYVIACPSSIEQAKQLMDEGKISPSPHPIDTNCTVCGQWWGNHPNKHKNCARKKSDDALPKNIVLDIDGRGHYYFHKGCNYRSARKATELEQVVREVAEVLKRHELRVKNGW